MKIVTTRDNLLKPLQQVGGVVERRQTLPILANVLINAANGKINITATDLEVEMKTSAAIECDGEIDFTLPARKLLDICKSLPEDANIEFNVDNERTVIRSGRSRFTLGVLPANDYPSIEPSASSHRFTVTQKLLKRLIEKTQFAMALQDVRYYLNGLLLEIGNGMIRAVATDGHRLALSEAECAIDQESGIQVILPRKAVLELARLLADTEDQIDIDVSSNHIRFSLGETSFTSKLIDGKFPDYQRVIPANPDKEVLANRDILKQALTRTSILSNEKYRGIRFQISSGLLQLLAHNPEQEEAEDEMEIDYQGDELVIGFNVGYLIEVLNVIESENVRMSLSDSNSSCLIQNVASDESRYVIMPMRL
ncbi:DNA polymerase III subunit beta [Sedimenticola selenatireducens]|uniref:Beta sliding clamp n=1 Tax=Sedimenticola selenatireducens TaxID=191960 RepID=A0A558DTR2_9GAMM|nr:DNA polymerase III subunit beta [Sedimenticola selenatireducens]TVO76845.1 DNA polymerase III subunit beta [Sedimenticola selenatireducens]TVT64288.1 MAG: DNA polymerase III subunit beta [Sedimenticola selenatireducens]